MSNVATAVPIDRAALVARHNPINRSLDVLSPLTVGNGEFAFTADVTGLQTFADEYERGICLCTMSQWGWHTAPPASPDPLPPLRMEMFETNGRLVGYATDRTGQEALFDYLRQNPHRLHLGRIGFALQRSDGSRARTSDLQAVHQELELWSGTLVSQFAIDGASLIVRTACHPARDVLAVQIEGELLRQGRVQIVIDFPGASPDTNAADWSHPQRHQTTITSHDEHGAMLQRDLDADRYFVRIDCMNSRVERVGDHSMRFSPRPAHEHELSCCFAFSAKSISDNYLAADVFSASRHHWREFWSKGAAVELNRSRDPRAIELERRVVLSQYLTAVQCAGSLPPQETGLTCNSWYGKFHLEMHRWHAAHFALWNRVQLLQRSLDWYQSILPRAKALAQSQGYAGARWPKMVGPEGCDAPSPIGPLLIWQQPHPIYFAELSYRAHPDAATLDRFAEIIEETATFMTSFATWDGARYVLGPPIIPAQECHGPRTTLNPTFELAYWKQGLQWAQAWRRRRGVEENALWNRIIDHLAPMPTSDGVYPAHERCSHTFEQFNRDHPSMLATFGMLNSADVDVETMRRTLQRVVREWDWSTAWGWDFPLAAMTAARVGEPQLAIEILLMESPKNRYLLNGHNFQRGDLRLYLPGNGALLTAVAMMASGWTGSAGHAPGFPRDGSWTVRAESFVPLPV